MARHACTVGDWTVVLEADSAAEAADRAAELYPGSEMPVRVDVDGQEYVSLGMGPVAKEPPP
jgi:hypothetical protein